MKTEAEAKAFVRGLADETAFERLQTLIEALNAENERQNLVASATLDTVWLRHIADSAQLLDIAGKTTGPWLDLGSGAGFPGLVLAIMRPNEQFYLVESRRRRIDWLESIVSQLQLENCTIHGTKLQNIETFEAGSITARAFAPLEKLLNLSARFSTAPTSWLLPKGRSAQQEVDGLNRHKRKMFHVEQSLTDESAGIIVGKGRMEAKR